MQNIIDRILGTAIHEWILSSPWVWPTFEILHFFGLCLLLGGLLIIDTRMMGGFKEVSFDVAHKLIPWVLAGFAINLCTGILFLFGDPERYVINIGFQIKVVLILLCGLNAALYFWKLDGNLDLLEKDGKTTGIAKLVGGASLGLWFGVLIMGRLIPYVGTG